VRRPDAADLPVSAVHPDELVPVLPRDAFLAVRPAALEMADPVEQGSVVPARAVHLRDEVLPASHLLGLLPQAVVLAVLLPGEAPRLGAHPAVPVLPVESDELLGVRPPVLQQPAARHLGAVRTALPQDAAELPVVDPLPVLPDAQALLPFQELLAVSAQQELRVPPVPCAGQLPVPAPRLALLVSQQAQAQRQDAARSSLSPRRFLPPQPLPLLPRARGNVSAPARRARCQSNSSASSSP